METEAPAGPLPSREDRIAVGAKTRVKAPPASLGSWSPSPDRVDPIELLESQSTTRLQDLVPVRYGRMAVSPFTFYRGAALPMAADLAAGPNSGITVQLCGDAHVSNFGLFASPERALLFDINDFDETLPGPFEFDLKRLAASLVVAGRELGVSAHDARHMVHRAMRSYRERMAGYATMRAIDVYYARVDASGVLAYANKAARGMIKRTVKATAHHDSVHELPKLTVARRRQAPHRGASPDAHQAPRHDPAAGRFGPARRIARRCRRTGASCSTGIGSTDLRAQGRRRRQRRARSLRGPLHRRLGRRSAVPPGQASGGVRVRAVSRTRASTRSHGERVVTGQRRLQAASDILLGWTVGERGQHVYIRQLQDQKGSAVIDTMTAEELATWGELCAWALARGHARSGDPAAIAGYLGTDKAFDHAMATFAEAYADQNEQDHAALLAAIKSGRITAVQGV